MGVWGRESWWGFRGGASHTPSRTSKLLFWECEICRGLSQGGPGGVRPHDLRAFNMVIPLLCQLPANRPTGAHFLLLRGSRRGCKLPGEARGLARRSCSAL